MRRLFPLSLSLAVGCALAGSPESTAGEAPPTADEAQAQARDLEAEPTITPPAPPTAEPSTDMPIRIVAAAGDCPAVHKGRSLRAAVLAHVLTRLACEPELFTLRTEALYRELGSPDGITVAFASPGLIMVDTDELPTATELTTVLGVQDPQMRLHWQAYHDTWSLDIDEYGPGSINVSLANDADYEDPPGKLEPVTHQTRLTGSLSVGLPDAVYEMLPDPAGLAAIHDALSEIAADETLLELEPEVAAERLGVDRERFRMARTSIHAGGNITNGLSLSPSRTRLEARQLVETLGIPGARAVNVNREHDVWEIESDGSTEIQWNGLTIELSLAKVEDRSRRHQDLGDAIVDFITIFP